MRQLYIIYPDLRREGPLPEDEVRLTQQEGGYPPGTTAWAAGMDHRLPVQETLQYLEEAEGRRAADSRDDSLPDLKTFDFVPFCKEIFRRHSVEEVSDLFCCGSRATTPPLSAVEAKWPAPWLFSRVLLVCLLCYLGFYLAITCFPESIHMLFPGWMFVGNFALPFSTLVLFFELNICRDYPFHRVVVAMCLGGVISLVCALFLFSGWDAPAELAGVLEEPAKFLPAMLLGGGLYKKRILTGILLGGAVGAGFAAFESAGYVFGTLLDEESTSTPAGVLHLRAALAPFGHVVWTAMVAGAFCRTVDLLRRKGREFTRIYHGFRVFAYASFLRIFATAVVLHVAWNSLLLGHIFIGLIGWGILLRLVYTGILQVRNEQAESPDA